MELGLGGLDYFLAAFAGTELSRAQGAYGGPGNVAAIVGTPFKITFWDAAFSGLEQVATRWLVSHEFGHIWDAKHLLSTSYKLEKATGGTSCLLEMVASCSYTPGETELLAPISGYAGSNRREDWAESFAALMFGGSWTELAKTNIHQGITSDPFTVSYNRIIFAAQQVRAFQMLTDFLEPFPSSHAWGSWGVGGY